MKITILSVGKQNVSYLSEGEIVYLKRLKHYVSIEQIHVPAEKISKNTNINIVKEGEVDKLLGKLPHSAFIVAMDERGKQVTSEQFAKKLEDFQIRSIPHLVFVIGGPFGLSSQLREKADWVLSLSKMTLMHDMVPLILLEQLYRAFTIIKGEKYHK